MATSYVQRASKRNPIDLKRISYGSSAIVVFFSRLKLGVSRIFRAITRSFHRRPIVTFLSLLALLLIVIIAGHTLRQPAAEQPAEPQPKQVSTFRIGTAPKVAVQGRVEKEGITQVVALTPGVVSTIAVAEGQAVGQGQNLVTLASNYQGGNAASVQRQLAQAQLNNTKNTFSTQKELIEKQREIANRQDAQADELRVLQAISNEEARISTDQTEDILENIDENIQDLEENNHNDVNDPLIEAANQLKTQFLGSYYGSRAQSRINEYNAREENSPAIISDLSREATLKQLEAQEKGLQLQLESAKLQTQLAQVTEASYYPASPFAGTVGRVHVQIGQVVNPGTPLVTVQGTNQKASVVAFVPQTIAQSISKIDAATITIAGKTFDATPAFVSTEATEGDLYSVIFDIPEAHIANTTNNASVTVQLPIATSQTQSTTIFVPLDAVFQTEQNAYVFVVENDTAAVRQLSLGEITGNFVTVINGLTATDEVIVNRTVVNGEKVRRI